MKFRKLLSTPLATGLLFVLAVGLIGFGGIRGAQAAPRIISEWYGAQVEMTEIETALVENDIIVEGDNTLLKDSFFKANKDNGLAEDGSGFAIGKTYDEVLTVENVGTIPQYVRVSVYRYWVDADGNALKNEDSAKFDPEYIELGFATDGGWSIDKDASTEERVVLYYNRDLAVGERLSDDPFVTTVRISPEVSSLLSADGSYKYEGVNFRIEATVDAVQTHNGSDAMRSAWGQTNAEGVA